MVRQNSVKAAFSKPEAVRSSTSFITKCCRCCCLLVSLLVFLMILGAGSGPVNDNALSGQAHHASIQNKVNSSRARDYDATAWHYDKSSEYDYDEVENVVGEAKLILEKAEQDVLQEEESLLKKAVTAGGQALRAGIKKVLGAGATDQDIEAIAAQVEEEVVSDAMDELREDAEIILQEELDGVSEDAYGDVSMGYDRATIRHSIGDRRDHYTSDMRTRIGGLEHDYQEQLPEKSLELEKKLLEKKLSAKYGRDVHLSIVAGEVRATDDGYLRSTKNKKKKKRSKNRNHYGTTTDSYGGGGGTTTSSGYGGGTASTGYGAGTTSGARTSSYGDTATNEAASQTKDDDGASDDDDGVAGTTGDDSSEGDDRGSDNDNDDDTADDEDGNDDDANDGDDNMRK